MIGGGQLAGSLFDAGLIDEIGCNVHPVLLRTGVPLAQVNLAPGDTVSAVAAKINDAAAPVRGHAARSLGLIGAAAKSVAPELISLLKEDIELVADGGGHVIEYKGVKLTAATQPIVGRINVARFLVKTLEKVRNTVPDFSIRWLLVNGAPCIVSYAGADVLSATSFDIVENQIGTVFVQTNPEKMKRLRLP